MKYIFLTEEFYSDYAHCPEIEYKIKRPYAQVLLKIEDLTVAVPLRSNINHPYVFWTDKENRCGLDFSKSVIITDEKYIDKSNRAHLRPLEFKALRHKDGIIKKELRKYIRTYKKARKNREIPRNDRICKYSALQYFEEFIY